MDKESFQEEVNALPWNLYTTMDQAAYGKLFLTVLNDLAEAIREGKTDEDRRS